MLFVLLVFLVLLGPKLTLFAGRAPGAVWPSQALTSSNVQPIVLLTKRLPLTGLLQLLLLIAPHILLLHVALHKLLLLLLLLLLHKPVGCWLQVSGSSGGQRLLLLLWLNSGRLPCSSRPGAVLRVSGCCSVNSSTALVLCPACVDLVSLKLLQVVLLHNRRRLLLLLWRWWQRLLLLLWQRRRRRRRLWLHPLLLHGWWAASSLGCCCCRAGCCSASSDTEGHIDAVYVSKLCCQRRSSSGRRCRCRCSSSIGPAGCSSWRAARRQLWGCSLLPDWRPWR